MRCDCFSLLRNVHMHLIKITARRRDQPKTKCAKASENNHKIMKLCLADIWKGHSFIVSRHSNATGRRALFCSCLLPWLPLLLLSPLTIRCWGTFGYIFWKAVLMTFQGEAPHFSYKPRGRSFFISVMHLYFTVLTNWGCVPFIHSQITLMLQGGIPSMDSYWKTGMIGWEEQTQPIMPTPASWRLGRRGDFQGIRFTFKLYAVT